MFLYIRPGQAQILTTHDGHLVIIVTFSRSIVFTPPSDYPAIAMGMITPSYYPHPPSHPLHSPHLVHPPQQAQHKSH
jgi:hypothetical protein